MLRESFEQVFGKVLENPVGFLVDILLILFDFCGIVPGKLLQKF